MKKTSVRIISLIIVAVLVITLFYSVAVMVAHAAGEPQPKVITGSVIIPGTIRQMLAGRADSQRFSIKFQFRVDESVAITDVPNAAANTAGDVGFALPESGSFDDYYYENNDPAKTTTLSIKDLGQKIGNAKIYEAVLYYISYNGGTDCTLKITDVHANNGADYMLEFDVPIPNKYIRQPSTSSSNSSSDTEEPPKSDIQFDTAIIKNAAGKQLDNVNKDTPPFTVEITYYDIGLSEIGRAVLEDAKMSAFITSADGFKALGGTSGEVKLISTTGKYPKYRITFKNLQCDETSSKLGFRVQYNIDEYTSGIKGESTAVLHQIVKKETESETTATLVPKIIVSEYGYGKESIIAGEEFSLDLSFRNTSSTAGIENVDITIEPGNGFRITAASNTAYFPTLATNETKNFSVTMRANPAASSSVAGTTPTDYSVQIKFSYQYLNDKKYADGSSNVKISIPVTQLDRFGVDEITDYSQYIMLGEEGYVTVPITNKGKSSIYNITGEIKNDSGADFVAAPVHFGNLDAGKSGTVDISLSISTPGVFEGKAVVTYEDENMNQKEMSVPFSIMVMEPPPPQIEAPPDMQQQAPAGPGLPSIILCAAGALMMAVPLSLYIIKRVKAKGIEAIDEDY